MRLREIALEDRQEMFATNRNWAHYRARLLCVCLCQGGALHYLDPTHGLNDFDVFTFFAAAPDRPIPDPALYRRNKPRDYGPSRLGRSGVGPSWFKGRRVDMLSRALEVAPGSNPVPAIQSWLDRGREETAQCLAEKAVVMVEPEIGRVIWPIQLAL